LIFRTGRRKKRSALLHVSFGRGEEGKRIPGKRPFSLSRRKKRRGEKGGEKNARLYRPGIFLLGEKKDEISGQHA